MITLKVYEVNRHDGMTHSVAIVGHEGETLVGCFTNRILAELVMEALDSSSVTLALLEQHFNQEVARFKRMPL